MTKSTTDIPILDDDAVAEVEARYKAATPGPWAVWDSCSWRRIGTVEPFRDGNVICPIIQNDGHPDLLAKREDLEFVAHAREDVPALCQTVRVLRAERLEVQRALASSVLNDPTEDDDPPYSTTELVNGILGLIARKESLLKQYVTQKTELKRLLAKNKQLEADVTRFSELADRRHDELCAARRQRDDLAAKCAPYLENLK